MMLEIVSFQASRLKNASQASQLKCGFWEIEKAVWSTRGCFTTFDKKNGVLCSCNHLTDFSVLFVSLCCSKNRKMQFVLLNWIFQHSDSRVFLSRPTTFLCLFYMQPLITSGQITGAHGTDVSVGIQFLSREILLQAKTPLVIDWTLTQVLADSIAR